MKEVKSIKEMNWNASFNINVSFNDKKKLFALGLWSGSNNDSFKERPTIEQIKKASKILSKYYGMLTCYYLWECKVTGYRIVFGNPKHKESV